MPMPQTLLDVQKETFKPPQKKAKSSPPPAAPPADTGMPAEGMPGEAPPTPGTVMAAEEDVTVQQIRRLAAENSVPPTSPIPMQAVEAFMKAIVAFAAFVSDGQTVLPPWPPPPGASEWNQPPPEIAVVVLVALRAALEAQRNPEMLARLPDPKTIVDAASYADATAKLEAAMRDEEMKNLFLTQPAGDMQ